MPAPAFSSNRHLTFKLTEVTAIQWIEDREALLRCNLLYMLAQHLHHVMQGLEVQYRESESCVKLNVPINYCQCINLYDYFDNPVNTHDPDENLCVLKYSFQGFYTSRKQLSGLGAPTNKCISLIFKHQPYVFVIQRI